MLNSVDEKFRNDGGISQPIGEGCKVTGINKDPLEVGDLDISPCNGPYRDGLNVRWVGSAAIIVWNKTAERLPCSTADCVSTKLDAALGKLFDEMRLRELHVDTMVLPAIGTGTGHTTLHVEKETFYRSVGKQLLAELQQPAGKNVLPSRIIFQVYRNDGGQQWINTKYAIAESLDDLSNQWNTKIAHDSSNLSSLGNIIGVSGSLLILVLVVVTGLPPPLPLKVEFDLLKNRTALVTLGWGCSALGVLKLLQTLADGFVPSTSLGANIVCGAIAVLACVLVRRAQAAAEGK